MQQVQFFTRKRAAVAVVTLLGVGLAANPAFAQAVGGAGNFTTFLQNFLNLLTGPLGQTVAALAICFSAIGLAFGVIRFHSLVAVFVAIMILFSSNWFVNGFIGGG